MEKEIEKIIDDIRGSEDYRFISSKMGDVVIYHLTETILNTSLVKQMKEKAWKYDQLCK